MRITRQLALTGAVAFSAAALSATSAPAVSTTLQPLRQAGPLRSTAHPETATGMYVGLAYPQQGEQKILRFPLVNGLPSGASSVLTTAASGPDAIFEPGAALKATLYATSYSATSTVIDAIDTTSGQVLRQITLPKLAAPSDGWLVQQLATDTSGNLYVALQEQFYASRHHAEPNIFSNGVAVYGPSANGTSPPIQEININGVAITGVALDSAGNMYIDGTGAKDALVIQEYQNPATNPLKINTITCSVNGLGEGPWQIQIAGGTAYVGAVTIPTGNYEIVEFPTSDSGPSTPSSAFVASSGSVYGNFVLNDNYLYVASQESSYDDAYVYSLANGLTGPVATESFSLFSPYGIALGP